MKTVAAALLLVGCSVGAPPGFSGGDSWQVPMIGPLENGLVMVPVFINGKGPYTFALDSDSNVSVITKHIAIEAKLDLGKGPMLDDESDTQQIRYYAETLGLEVGTLTVGRLSTEVLADHAFDFDGRVIDGLIGRDIIADSLAFEIDRDRGVVTIMTQKAYERSAPGFAGTPIKYKTLSAQILAQIQPVPRNLVTAQIDGQPFSVHLDLGATTSQLRERSWQKAGLVAHPQAGRLIDEVGSPRNVDHLGQAASVTVDGVTATNVNFAPYDDKRWHDEDIEGSLGLDFFRDQNVLVDWNTHTFLTKPRTPEPTAARISRWHGSLMPQCPHVGCVTTSVIDPLANTPVEQRPQQHPGVVVSVVRDPQAANVALEVLIAARSSAADAHLRWLVVNLPANVDRAMTHLSARYLGSHLDVVDASPFPRTCPAPGSCIDEIQPRDDNTPVPPQPEPQPTASR
jgi:Aspartyl protease